MNDHREHAPPPEGPPPPPGRPDRAPPGVAAEAPLTPSLWRFPVLLTLLLLGFAGTAESQVKRAHRVGEQDPGDAESIHRQHGMGRIPLGATAKGDIVLGFYNMITFEAVEGTSVALHVKTRHPQAKLVAELLSPGRGEKIPFQPLEKDPRHLVLENQILKKTGLYTVRFGFTTEHNGDYTLTSSAVFPPRFAATIDFSRQDRATLRLPGMAGRKIRSLSIDMPDGVALEAEMADPHGFRIDLTKHLKMQNWDRRIVISDLVIESNDQYELRLKLIEGRGGPAQVTVEYANPTLSKKTLKI